jgi:hypothetical protein
MRIMVYCGWVYTLDFHSVLQLTLLAAFQRVSQSSFGIILKTNSELNSVSSTLMSLACKEKWGKQI